MFCFPGLPVAQPHQDVVDYGAGQGQKVEGQGQKVELTLSDDWHKQLHVVLCSQQFKDKIIRQNGQEASIRQISSIHHFC